MEKKKLWFETFWEIYQDQAGFYSFLLWFWLLKIFHFQEKAFSIMENSKEPKGNLKRKNVSKQIHCFCSKRMLSWIYLMNSQRRKKRLKWSFPKEQKHMREKISTKRRRKRRKHQIIPSLRKTQRPKMLMT